MTEGTDRTSPTTAPRAPEVRPVHGPEVDACYDVVAKVFGMARSSPEGTEAERLVLPDERLLGAVTDRGEVVGTAGSYLFDLSMPGGELLGVAGVTNVGVLPTHRRRGILRSLMTHQLEAVAAEGLPAAILDASEAGIYGRFGYGMASRYSVWTIRCDDATFVTEAPARTVRFVDQAEAAPVLAPIYDAALRSSPGDVSRVPKWWELLLRRTERWKGGGNLYVAVVDPDPSAGEPGGYVIYSVGSGRDGDIFSISIRELVSASPDTAAALWRFCLDVDLASHVSAEVAVDDPLIWRLADPRAARTKEVRDYLFVRLLDVEKAYSARRWSAPVDLVVEVRDGLRPDVAGRYRLVGGPDSSSCVRTGDPADLELDVADLGSLLLGGFAPSNLAAAGRIRELTPGALAAADAAFRWSRAPFCRTRF